MDANKLRLADEQLRICENAVDELKYRTRVRLLSRRKLPYAREVTRKHLNPRK